MKIDGIECMNRADVELRLGVKRAMVNRLIAAGRLRTVTVGIGRAVTVKSIKAFEAGRVRRAGAGRRSSSATAPSSATAAN